MVTQFTDIYVRYQTANILYDASWNSPIFYIRTRVIDDSIRRDN